LPWNRLSIALSATALVVAVLGLTPAGNATSDALATHFARNALFLRNNAPSVKAGRKRIPLANSAGRLDRSWLPGGGPAQPIVGFASVTAAGTVRTFGGAGTTGVTVASCGPGCKDVTFAGSFPGVSGSDDLTVLVGAVDSGGGLDVASGGPRAGTTTRTVIRARTWSLASQPPTAADREVSIAVLKR
jgi:hypothetical protein